MQYQKRPIQVLIVHSRYPSCLNKSCYAITILTFLHRSILLAEVESSANIVYSRHFDTQNFKPKLDFSTTSESSSKSHQAKPHRIHIILLYVKPDPATKSEIQEFNPVFGMTWETTRCRQQYTSINNAIVKTIFQQLKMKAYINDKKYYFKMRN